MKTLLGLVLLCAVGATFARTDQLIIDQYMSPYAGTAANLSILHTYTYLDDRFLPSSADKATFLWGTARLGKVFLEDWLCQFLMVLQHEVFGHGYRLREFGFKHIIYYVAIGHGATGLSSEQEWDRVDALPWPSQAALSAAGMEANAVLSQQIRQNWFAKNALDYRDGLFYIITTLDQADYIWITTDDETDYGNDVHSYVVEVNAWHGNQHLSVGRLHDYALCDLLDPNLYHGFYAILMYIYNGSITQELDTLNIRGYKYFPVARLLLTPYGPEFQLQNYVLTPKQTFWQVNARYGNNSHIQSYGVDIFTKPVWRYKDWSFANKLYLWRQPKFWQQNTALGVHSGLGIAEFISAEYKFAKHFAAVGEFGYKTGGYSQGLPLGNSWVWRAGLQLSY